MTREMYCGSWISRWVVNMVDRRISSSLIIVLISFILSTSVLVAGSDEATTSAETTAPTKWQLKPSELSKDQLSGVVTLLFQHTDGETLNTKYVDEFNVKLRSVLVRLLNAPKPRNPDNEARRRRRRRGSDGDTTTHVYTLEDIFVVVVEPTKLNEHMRKPVFIRGTGGAIVSGDKIKRDIDDRKKTKKISDEMSNNLDDTHLGLPDDVQAALAASGKESKGTGRGNTIWDQHYWLFMTILIFIVCAAFISMLCCCCLWCRRRAPNHKTTTTTTPSPEPLKSSSHGATGPVPVHEPLITASKSQPAMAENRPHAAPSTPADEENGWIIPMDQLTQEELNQPDVQVSRL